MSKTDRRKFVISAAGLSVMSPFLYASSKQTMDIKLKGKNSSLIKHWDIITIGNLSRNRYWGENDEKPLRGAICTCTVVSGENFHLLIDPSIRDATQMATELDRRTGLSIGEIDYVFITHQHDDHLSGLKHFVNAKWYAGYEVAEALNRSGMFEKQIKPVEKTFLGAFDVIPMPGHTADSVGLRFDFNSYSIVITGDAVATKEYWDNGQMYYNVIDMEESKKTHSMIRSIADIIVPGHDNYFLNL